MESSWRSVADRIWLDTERSAVSVEWRERKPCWDEENRLLSDM